MLSKIFSAGDTGDTASTDLTVYQGTILLTLPLVLAVCHCSILTVPRVYSHYFGFCTFISPEPRVFRGSMLQVRPVLAVTWEDTASIGNILG